MNIKNIFSFLSRKAETATPKTITDSWFPAFSQGLRNTTGEAVTTTSALSLSAVWGCVNVISQDVSKIPFHCFQKTDKGKKRISNNLDKILNYSPNPFCSAMDFRQAMQANLLLYGNSFAEIQRDIDNRIVALWLLPSNRVKIKTEEGQLFYEVQSTNKTFYLYPEEVLHLKGLGSDGISGYSVITYAAQSLGSALAADRFAGSYFGNGSIMGGYLEHPQTLSDASAKNLKESIERNHRGVEQAHRLLLLEEGMKFSAGSITNQDSQFLETRQFHISDICRWFRIQPHKIADLSKATFSNIEQQSLEYVSDTLLGWFRKWEQECYIKLISEEEKEQGFFVEHVIEGLLRGDIQTRYAAYATARQWGWLSINDIRERENMDIIEGGDIYLQPLNMQNINAPAPVASTSIIKKEIASDIARRLFNAETIEIEKQLNRKDFDADKFGIWLEKHYAKHFSFVQKTMSQYTTIDEAEAKELSLYKIIKNEKNKEGISFYIKNIYMETLQDKIYELIK